MKGTIPLLSFHLDRLFHSLTLLQFDLPSFFTRTYIESRLLELVMKNGHQSLARVRITVFRGEGGVYDVINHQPHLLIQSWPLNPESNNLNENGLIIDCYSEARKPCDAFANLKSNNYLPYVMAALYAKKQHLNDALVLNQHGRVADATIANCWIVEKDKLVTPALSEGPVNGTMRRFILEQASAFGFTMVEEEISIERLQAADEVFLTNAIYGLKWVKQVGERLYPCQVSGQLHQRLLAPLWL